MNTPNVTHLSGLHGASLEAFREAAAVVDAAMRKESERAESLLRECRRLLRYANDVYMIDMETADAFVARAANKLALAIGAR